MSLVLHDLLACCRGLESDKATERKKDAERFRRLLQNPDVVQELDRASGAKARGSKQLTWDAVFRFLQRYVQKETESVQSSRANITSATLATRQKKMAEMCSLVKYFIRCANKRGPRLKCSDLLKHVMEVLQNSYSCAAYGDDYSSLLVKNILSVRKYWCDITPQQWHDLLEVYCSLFTSTSKSINRVLVSRVVRMLVQGCCTQAEGHHATLFGFFSKALLNARQEKHLSILEHMLSALNIFLRSVAMNCRMRLCHLGEELLPTVLQVWADMRPSAALKEEIVDFFNLQIRAHHPRGAKTPDEGAYAKDWGRWRSLLYSLYDALIREISHIGSRGKYVTGSRHIAVKDDLIELTADICHQLFSDDGDSFALETTQVRAVGVVSPAHGTPSKRRRVQLGWEVLRDHLQPLHSDFDIIPWLQIAAVLTSKYPSVLPGCELLHLLSLLHQLLVEQRRGERGPYVLRCLREVARCQARHPERALHHRTELRRLWARVWALALRRVTSPQTEAVSLDLLGCMVHGGLVHSLDRELWKLFSGAACKPSQAAALCLAGALLKCPLPKSLPSGSVWESAGVPDGLASSSLKEMLICWLLMGDQSDETEENSSPHPVLCRDFPDSLIANILVSLTLKDTRAGLTVLLGTEGAAGLLSKETTSSDLGMEEMERLYLQICCDVLPSAMPGGLRPGVTTPADGQFAVVPPLRNKVEQLLLGVADHLLNCYSPDSQSCPPECVVRCCSLLTGVLAAYVSTGCLTEEEACRSPLFTKARALALELSGFVSGVKVRMAEEGTMSAVASVLSLCTQLASRRRQAGVPSAFSTLPLMILPSSLLAELADVCKLLFNSDAKKAVPSGADEDDRVDDEWDVSTTQQGDGFDQFEEKGEGSHSSANGTHRQNIDSGDAHCGPGAKSLLVDDQLAQQDQALLAILDFLCECGSAHPARNLLFRPQDVRHRLLLLLKQKDFGKAVHLRAYLLLLQKLPVEDSLPPEEFDSLLCPLADACGQYRQDQEICAALLLALLPSIRSLGLTGHSAEDMRHVHGSLLQVVSAFCFLSQSGKYTAAVRSALVRCLVSLLEADPCCSWAMVNVQNSDGEELPVSTVLTGFLADTQHQVRMLVAVSTERLFVEIKPETPDRRRMLPRNHQQEAFKSVYLKAQEGMKLPRSVSQDDRADESFNRRAALLKCLSVIMCCSPVCEMQALFALFQSYKENNVEEKLILRTLCSVSRALGYRSVKSLVASHLYYLVDEWLKQRESDDRYTLGSFPYSLLEHQAVKDFYNSSYQVLVPHLVCRDDFEQVKSIGRCVERDWRELLADCFPKIMVNILPYFALSSQDARVAQQRETAHRVYDLMKDASCLGKQQIDNLIHNNLADIVVELLMTLYEGNGADSDGGDLRLFTGELDPAPNPPHFTSHVIKATLDYLSKCHSANHRSLVTILSRTPISIQRILLAVCQRADDTSNSYERHRILLMYHLFVNLLLREVKDGLGGAWAFVLRDVIYTLIHHLNGRPSQFDEVSCRSLSLCCDLLASVCRAALQYCDDALDCHLQVIVGTLTAQVTSRPAISEQVLALLQFLIVENQQKLSEAIRRLESFPNLPEFRELRSVQHKLKYSGRTFTLRQEISHFLSVDSCHSLPLTRLEGVKELSRQLHDNKGQIRELLKESQENGDGVLGKLVLSLLQLCKQAASHPGGADILEAAGSCLGELGPVDFSSIALLRGRDPLYAKAASLFTSSEPRSVYIVLNCLNEALTQQSIKVRQAAAQCIKDILAAPSGVQFWEEHKDSRDTMLAYLHPFRQAKKQVRAVSAEESSEARGKLESPTFWIPVVDGHKPWLKGLCAALLDSGGVKSEALLLSRPLCLASVECCQRLLPLIVHSILLDDTDGSWRNLLSTHIQDFFGFCSRSAQASSRSATPLNSHSESDSASQGLYDKASLRTLLAVVDYLRHQRRPHTADSSSSSSSGTVCDSNFWLELNYLEVAQAAQSCSAHFTALLYTEIYVDKIKATVEESRRSKSRGVRKLNLEDNSQTFSISSLTQKSMEDYSISLQELLIEVYRSIGEPDSMYGCGGETMSSPLTRIRTYEHEALWGKALTSYDLHCSLPEVTRHVGIVEGLQNFGLTSILATYMRGLESEGVEWGAELRELRFQAAWRNTQWDCELAERPENSTPGFHESMFCSLQALRDKEFSVFEEMMRRARIAEVEELCRGSLEAVSSLYPTLRNLQILRELESIRPLFSRPFPDPALGSVCRQWRQHSQLLADSDFAMVEPIMAARSVVQQTLASRAGGVDSSLCVGSVLTDHLMELCRLALKAGNTQLAERAVFQMKQHGGGPEPVLRWQLEEARVFWAKGEQGLALGRLRQMINSLEDKVDMDPAVVPIYTQCLRLCGTWLAETCLESPGLILEKYLERAVEVVVEDSITGQDDRLQSQRTEAFLSLARFSDAQYQSIDNYMRSSVFENKQALLEKAKEEVGLMDEHRVKPNRYTVKVKGELKLDQKALSSLRADRQRFLCKAVENYIQCLEEGEEHDTWVFRLASLWLGNAEVKAVNNIVKKGVRKIPPHKFLPLMYQLAARMGTKKTAAGTSEDSGFQDVLSDLICRACLQHPHHTLFVVFALVNADKDKSYSMTRLAKGAAQQPSQFDQERCHMAHKIISEVRQKRGQLIGGIQRLCDAYITLAYMDATRHKTEKKAIPIPADQPIMKIKDLEEVTIPTMEIKVDPSGRYDDLVTVRSFVPQYHLAGGVNLPKIIDCVGSDGIKRKQLVKGQDDLRQDAVMQQVFGMCSTLLQRNSDTRKRKLNIRRYKVVPFSQCSGVLEWCSGTVPIGVFLTDAKEGAHLRFRPQDWSSLACRRKMIEAQPMGFDAKLEAYSEVCRNFRPVFRYFCMERFLDPAVWMEKRLAYTRSVATSSIVGYIVGLGDRHIQNILIDEQTAELVHIDLGVAFEQGKVLPTPETVPFRLSRDIVDGMGITGVEGVFRRCCEKTMEVMRSSQEALLTIVEVLLYDPLFDWTMNPLKAFHLQHDEQQELNATLSSTMGGAGDDITGNRKASDSQSFNKVAERVLLRLQEKLKGVEEGAVLSVGGQVNLLIQQAMDPNNLSRLFHGWQAWV